MQKEKKVQEDRRLSSSSNLVSRLGRDARTSDSYTESLCSDGELTCPLDDGLVYREWRQVNLDDILYSD